VGDRVSAMRRRGLQIDDPLGPGHSAEPVHPPVAADPAAAEASEVWRGGQAGGETTDRAVSADSARKPNRRDRSTTSPAPSGRRRERAARSERPTPAGGEVWREWSGLTGVGSFRLPHELLAELGDTARELGLPIGLIVTAAITQLLDQPPEQIAALVDRADDARIHGRRTNRRRLTEPASG
jgi:hypothetical protein